MNKQKPWKYITLFLVVFLFDNIAKLFVLRMDDERLSVFPFLSLKRYFNHGISWGMFHTRNPGQFFIVVVLAVFIILPLVWHSLYEYGNGRKIWGEVLVIAGALANICDRLLYGGVVDFICLSYGDWAWPVFNIADMAIVVGVLLIIIPVNKKD